MPEHEKIRNGEMKRRTFALWQGTGTIKSTIAGVLTTRVKEREGQPPL